MVLRPLKAGYFNFTSASVSYLAQEGGQVVVSLLVFYTADELITDQFKKSLGSALDVNVVSSAGWIHQRSWTGWHSRSERVRPSLLPPLCKCVVP